MGEAAAVLRNYERRTGDVLKRRDLHEGTLQSKLTPEDYNIAGQVPSSTHLFPKIHFPTCLTAVLLRKVTILKFAKSLCKNRETGFPSTGQGFSLYALPLRPLSAVRIH